ncbi:MAG: hypothetical protein GXO93_08470 [FCB group bacterium]|nr:hypothetical protein [FCB group bacterium]
MKDIEKAIKRIHAKRLSLGHVSTEALTSHLLTLDDQIKRIKILDELNNKLDKLLNSNSLIRQVGMQVIVILIIGLMVFGFMYFGVDDFIFRIFKNLK